MELNAKIASLEDEVKLLKGEVKLILSEIRTAILGQDNPFAEPGQALRADAGALESRPPIRVVRVPSDDEEAETPEQPPPVKTSEAIWDDETEASVAGAEPLKEPEEAPPEEPAPTPVRPVAARRATAQPPEPAPVAHPEPEPAPAPAAAPPEPAAKPARAARAEVGTPHWSLITVAGLAVWAEEAARQIGSERLRILLDLCEFTGYLSAPAKEALLKVTSLAQEEERTTPPSANECLVVLCQLDALMRGEEPAGQSFRGLASKWQQPA
jgi:hypothetical protein